mgnify:CR=1 FL=1
MHSSSATWSWRAGHAAPPFFEGLGEEPEPVEDIRDARILALLGDSVTTDHISPAGSFKPDSPAGRYLQSRGVAPKDFNSYGSRRGNHEVMMRGTFANVRIRNEMLDGVEGGFTKKDGEQKQEDVDMKSETAAAKQEPSSLLGDEKEDSPM